MFSQQVVTPKGDRRKEAEYEGVYYYGSKPHEGLSLDKEVLHTGENSGYQAINLAFHRGSTHIILLGYDMGLRGSKTHWFGDHPVGLQRGAGYEGWAKRFDKLSKWIETNNLNLRIINCTRTTALNCFEKMSLESALLSVQDQALVKSS